jgi:CheY-like chemotaxis protein
MDEAKGAGIDAFLAKPISASTLLDTLAAVLGRAPAAPQRSRVAKAEAAHAALTGTHVLVADDSPFNRQVEAELLAGMGVVVDLAENGREAVAKALWSGAPYDAVLMDVQMPEMDGLEATRQIRQHRSAENLPVIALTAHALEEERQRCLAAGMNDHVTKPIDPATLAATLGRWIRPRPPARTTKDRADGGELPVSLPPFDITAALTRLNGKRDLLRHLILSFHQEFAGAVPNLAQAVAGGDVEAAGRIGHTLKSAAAMLGLRDVAEAARSIEEKARNGGGETLQATVETLEAALVPALAAAASLRRLPDSVPRE